MADIQMEYIRNWLNLNYELIDINIIDIDIKLREI